MKRVFRIAPTPSGYLHAGNMYSFLLTWLMARKAGAQILLRIDDLDSDRLRAEFVEDIFASFNRLGIDYDLGPRSAGELQTVYTQNLHVTQIASWAEKLSPLESSHFYACDCPRSKWAEHAVYPGYCRDKSLEWRGPFTENVAVLRAKFENDLVVWTRFHKPSYQLMSVYEDLHWGVTDVVRGEDLLGSTAFQKTLAHHLVLQGIQSAEEFSNIQFLHHPLLLNDAGEKLSKSQNAERPQSKQEVFEGFKAWASRALVKTHPDWAQALAQEKSQIQCASDLLRIL